MAIKTNSPEHGTLSVEVNGTIATIHAQPDEGYILGDVIATCSGEMLDVVDMAFTIPEDGDVEVSVSFLAIEQASTTQEQRFLDAQYSFGEVRFEVDGNAVVAAYPGQTVQVVAKPFVGYRLESISGTNIDMDTMRFTMPDSNVSLVISFVQINYVVECADGVVADVSIAHAGDIVTATATSVADGEEFLGFAVVTENGFAAQNLEPVIEFEMPPFDVLVRQMTQEEAEAFAQATNEETESGEGEKEPSNAADEVEDEADTGAGGVSDTIERDTGMLPTDTAPEVEITPTEPEEPVDIPPGEIWEDPEPVEPNIAPEATYHVETRYVSEIISDFSEEAIEEYKELGAVAIAVYSDGTTKEVPWDEVSDPAKPAGEVINEAAEVAAAINQHFWSRATDDEKDGAGTGAFVTDDEQDAFLAAAKSNFKDLSDSKPYHNILLNSLGILLRRAKYWLVSITKSAIAFYDGNGNAETNIVARFGADGAQIGKTSSNHITITANGLGIYSGDTYANVNGVDVGQAASNAATAKSDAASAKALVTASVKNADVEYYQSTSATELKGGSWQTKAPTWKDGTYIWTRTKWTQNGGETTYSTATCITGNTGAKGDTGAKGATGSTGATGAKGKGVSSITELYYCSSSATAPAKPTATVTTNAANQYNKWNKQPATWTSTYKYYYTCSEILYDDNTRAWSDVVANNGMTTANSTAATAKSTADTAKTTADNAKTAADEAKSVANATKQNFWADTSGVHVSTQANTAAGTFNSLFNANGLLFREASNNLLSLTGSALNFYDGSGNAAANVQASFGTTTQLGKTADYHYYGTSTTMGIYPGGNNTAANAVFYVNNTPSVRIGNQAADKANVYITNAGLYLRSNTTNVGRFLINQSVGWLDDYGTAQAPVSSALQIDGGSASAYFKMAGNIAMGGDKVRVYSNGRVAFDVAPYFFSNIIRRVNARTSDNTAGKIQHLLNVAYYGDGVETKTENGETISIVSPNATWSNSVLRTASGDANGHAVLLGGGGLTIVGAGEFADNFYNLGNYAAGSESLHLGSDGATYIYTNGNTIANRKTYTFSTAGNLSLPQNQASVVYTGSTITETTPSSNKYEGGCYINDAGSAQAAYFRGLHQTNGNRGLQLEARRGTSGAYKYNTLNLTIDTSGNAVVGVGGTNVAAAWRSAIGANNASNINAGTLAIARGGTGATGVTKTTSGVVTALSGYTIAEQSMTQWGKVVTLRLRVTSTNATSGSRQVATVASGYRPTYLTVGQDWEPTRACYVDTGGQVYIKGAMNAGVTEIMSFMYLIP